MKEAFITLGQTILFFIALLGVLVLAAILIRLIGIGTKKFKHRKDKLSNLEARIQQLEQNAGITITQTPSGTHMIIGRESYLAG